MMASAQVVETSVNTNNSPSQDYTTNPDDHSNHNSDSPGFKPFTVILLLLLLLLLLFSFYIIISLLFPLLILLYYLFNVCVMQVLILRGPPTASQAVSIGPPVTPTSSYSTSCTTRWASSTPARAQTATRT